MVRNKENNPEVGLATDVNTRIQSLIRLARERGYVSLQDINEVLPGVLTNSKEAENIINILENLNIEILDADEAERHRSKIEEEMAEPSFAIRREY